ncbi:tRNA threonylcarbamoyladenosine biosynthesis protein TsaE [Candidatus Clavichlamydia salmonicola]|uniref:tRNA (adenosine(37)-N6)-threonylcarbamoyltransferase complex ATPase subunit type 1 TsaE n=1 Tax=Candidatus Clavichlamydia salmonicola TaxID=469812 RepID=UPI001891D262|nr:tRNA (adenosine(37)-N6)-threonylcarbamoyltransferase complex ATPase subunit type 1 TsaE [Candidatus Clavichlamydia salmonicola]MBF5050743.1 tRNA threonylcarbamoyladenosine biosynthesis protein TsaE [Candidatus Clavichlamydia salmonicola]
MGRCRRLITHSEEETFLVGSLLGKFLQKDTIIFLYGDLGAGKTLLTKGMASFFCQISSEDISSPTYAYLHIYGDDTLCFYHFDLYRLVNGSHFFELGFDEFCKKNGPVVIEWPEKLDKNFFEPVFEIHLTHIEEGLRDITFSGFLGFDWAHFLACFEVMRQGRNGPKSIV